MKPETLQGFQLSPQQKKLWQLQQNSNVYFSQAVIVIEGIINLKILEEAVKKVIDRHEILRTNFCQRSGMSIPFQLINESNKITWQSIAHSNLSRSEIEAELAKLLSSEKSAQFNLDRDSLLRLLLIKLNDNRYYLIITLPSLCADSQTINNLVGEISQSYSLCLQEKNFLEEPVQYIQFSEWQNELSTEVAEAGRDYWQQQQSTFLQNCILPGELDKDLDREIKSDTYSLTIEQQTNKINLVVAQYNTDTSNFLRACWYILIWKLNNHSEIAISNLFTGRKYEELENTYGLLAQFLPINCVVSKQFTFSEILSNLANQLQQAEQYQEYYLHENSDRVSRIRESSLDIGFEFEQLPNRYDADGLSFSLLKKDIQLENFKIKLTCWQQQDSLITEFNYDTNQYAPENITRLAKEFHTLIESVIANTEATVGELNILDRQQRHQLLVEFNNNQTNYPQDKCIHQLFEAQVTKSRDSIAVVCDSEELTYSELNREADVLANYLRQKGVRAETLVGLYTERSINTIVGLLGILKAGAAYLPLDSALPAEGLTFRLQDAGVSVLLTQRSLVNKIPANIPEIICLDTDQEAIEAENQNNSHDKEHSENLVYTIYTSGSTGQPKAVGVEHRQLVNYVYAIIERLNISPGASFATVSTFAADLGNTMLFPSLCTGGCLHIIDQETAADPQGFSNYCQRYPIDYLKIVPSHLSALLSSTSKVEFLPQKQLILGGEASNWDLIAKIQQQKPNCQIFNHYGPTETTVGVLTYQIESENNHQLTTVPIGKPLPNNKVYILDEQLQPVPLGVPGELYIGGAQVSRGYLNRPELTAERFIKTPIPHQSPLIKEEDCLYKTGDQVRYLPDGNIEFLGRIDRQVKIRGFRIELGEIETLLQQHSGIQSAVVIANEESLDNKRLIAYIVTDPQFRLLHQNQDTAIASELRGFCTNQFPEYMIPSAFVVLKALPLTANGKIDYRALPTPEQTRPELEQLYIAPRSPLEQQLAEIWTEVLGLEKIGIHDNFFELGGHSLLITQLLAKVRNTFDVELPLKDLFNAPTIADLAESINQIVGIDGNTERHKEGKTSINLNSEAILDPDIVPGDNFLNTTIIPKSILLTGATGFLGAFLLHELLEKTTADIYCLIRAENITQAQKRIENKLQSYLLWDENFSGRIIPVVGDLSQPLLGLPTDRFNTLAESVDAIYHNGAWVNFTYPYSQLKAANVLGTQEVLRLAVQSKVKPVHFISTIGVVGAADRNLEIVSETTPIDRSKQIKSGYTQSKWVAEKLVTTARDRHIPVTIYRPGRISGHSQTGVCNPDDHTFRMIRGCIQLGTVPQDDSLVNLTPVDFAVGAIVHLSNQPESLGKTFHLFNPQPTPWSEVVNSIISLGYPLKQLDYQQWRKELLTTAERSPDHALFPLISTFDAPHKPPNSIRGTGVYESETPHNDTEESINQELEASNTNSGLAETSIVCPKCDRQLLSTYFSYLIDQGFLIPNSVKNSELN
jgi:amino acid adenylation domain-containing protein/thioester reductase-like protein